MDAALLEECWRETHGFEAFKAKVLRQTFAQSGNTSSCSSSSSMVYSPLKMNRMHRLGVAPGAQTGGPRFVPWNGDANAAVVDSAARNRSKSEVRQGDGTKGGQHLDAEKWLQVAAFLYEKAQGLKSDCPTLQDPFEDEATTILPNPLENSVPVSVRSGDSPSTIIEMRDLDGTASSYPGGFNTPRTHTPRDTLPPQRECTRGVSPDSTPNTTCSLFNLTRGSTPCTVSKASEQRQPLVPMLLTPSAADNAELGSLSKKTSESKIIAWSLSDKPTGGWADRQDGTCARSLSYLSDDSDHSQPALIGEARQLLEDQENRRPELAPKPRETSSSTTPPAGQIPNSRWQVVQAPTSKPEPYKAALEERAKAQCEKRFIVVAEPNVSPRPLAPLTPPTARLGQRVCMRGPPVSGSANVANVTRRPGISADIPQGVSSSTSDSAKVQVGVASMRQADPGAKGVRKYAAAPRSGIGSLQSPMSASSLTGFPQQRCRSISRQPEISRAYVPRNI
mmetsp:Transcript_66527/g.124094  ORF Transcript_66527/g.124094 Transcript_66527/m.124094 type:complete len:507 (+) Transcript_66527:45-1565(+)